MAAGIIDIRVLESCAVVPCCLWAMPGSCCRYGLILWLDLSYSLWILHESFFIYNRPANRDVWFVLISLEFWSVPGFNPEGRKYKPNWAWSQRMRITLHGWLEITWSDTCWQYCEKSPACLGSLPQVIQTQRARERALMNNRSRYPPSGQYWGRWYT
jgi:hypothetical protein